MSKILSFRAGLVSGARLLLVGAIAVTAAFTQTSCTSEEIAISLGAGAIGVIVGSELSREPRQPRCHAGHATRCTDYYDRWGHYRRQCRSFYDRCAYYSSTATADGQVSREAQVVAQNHGLSFDSAEKFMRAINQAQLGDASAVNELGLKSEDVRDLVAMKTPSEETLMAVALNLDTTSETVRKMISSFQSDIRAQAADFNSPLWKTCRDSGTWKTPENSLCTKDYWSGCSPATGATMCAAVN